MTALTTAAVDIPADYACKHPLRLVNGAAVEVLRLIPVHGSTPNGTVEPASFDVAIGDAGSLSEWLA